MSGTGIVMACYLIPQSLSGFIHEPIPIILRPDNKSDLVISNVDTY